MPDVSITKNHFNSILLRWLFKLLISTALLVFIFRQISLRLFLDTLRSMHIGYLCLSILAFFPIQLLITYRWWYLLSQMGCNQPYRRVMRLSLLGQFSTLFLPGQISGDVVRAFGMAREEKSKERVAFSVVVDKLAFLVAIATFSTVGWFLKSRLSPYIGVYVFSLGLFIMACGAIVVFGRYRSKKLEQWIVKWVDHCPPGFRNFFSILLNWDIPPLSYKAIGYTILLGYSLQFLNALGSYMMARSMDIMLPMFEWAVIQAMVSLVQVLPISLGGLGVREGTFVLLLSLYTISSSRTIAYSITSFLISAILITICWLAAESVGQNR
jgi:uncharacterized protein (TIRG00374 family)